MYKIKLFFKKTDEDKLSELEAEVNGWLAKNPDIEILVCRQTHYQRLGFDYLSLMILYRKEGE